MSLGPQRVRHLRARASKLVNSVRGMIRRLTIGKTDGGGLWQLLGYDGADGEKETFDDAEVFSGVGFYSRPRDGASAEVIVVNVGGEENHPIVIATRDKSAQVSIEPDETVMFNSGATIKITKDGDVIVTQKAGRQIMLGGSGLLVTDGVVHGTGIDTFTGATYAALNSTAPNVRAKK